MKETTPIGIALGSNVGDRLGNLRAARDRLIEWHLGSRPPLFSSVFETAPVDCEPGTQAFLNAVIEVESKRSPREWLDYAQTIESELGRPAVRPANSPRTIDIDLLYAGEQRIATRRLDLPHPRLHERRFVLVPLREIRPDLVLPGSKDTVAGLLADLGVSEPNPVLLSSQW